MFGTVKNQGRWLLLLLTTLDSNKNDTKTERNVQTEGKRAVLCNINIMEKERGNPTYLLSRIDHRLIIMRETVFKVQSDSDKVLCSRNAPRSCIHCLVESKPGSPDFPVCSGCRCVRYCVRPELILQPRLTKKNRVANTKLPIGLCIKHFVNSKE